MIRVGSRVRVTHASLGWGDVHKEDIGIVKKIQHDGIFLVDFRRQTSWSGRLFDFEELPGKTTKAKKIKKTIKKKPDYTHIPAGSTIVYSRGCGYSDKTVKIIAKYYSMYLVSESGVIDGTEDRIEHCYIKKIIKKAKKEEVTRESVLISGKIHNEIVKVAKKFNFNTRRPFIYMLGADKNGVIRKMARIKGREGCHEMPSITATEFSNTFLKIIKTKTTAVGVIRIGDFDDFHEDGDRGMSLIQLGGLSPNLIVISYSIDKSPEVRCQSYNRDTGKIIEYEYKIVK